MVNHNLLRVDEQINDVMGEFERRLEGLAVMQTQLQAIIKNSCACLPSPAPGREEREDEQIRHDPLMRFEQAVDNLAALRSAWLAMQDAIFPLSSTVMEHTDYIHVFEDTDVMEHTDYTFEDTDEMESDTSFQDVFTPSDTSDESPTLEDEHIRVLSRFLFQTFEDEEVRGYMAEIKQILQLVAVSQNNFQSPDTPMDSTLREEQVFWLFRKIYQDGREAASENEESRESTLQVKQVLECLAALQIVL